MNDIVTFKGKKMYKLEPGVDLTKLFFFANA